MCVYHLDPLETTEHNPYNYPDELLATLCDVCHGKTEQQDGELLWPVNGRGDEAHDMRTNRNTIPDAEIALVSRNNIQRITKIVKVMRIAIFGTTMIRQNNLLQG